MCDAVEEVTEAAASPHAVLAATSRRSPAQRVTAAEAVEKCWVRLFSCLCALEQALANSAYLSLATPFSN